MNSKAKKISAGLSLIRWFDSHVDDSKVHTINPRKVDWLRCIPFFGVQLASFAVIAVGWSPIAVWTAVALFYIRMFAITGFYHRYFAHKTFRTNRICQFIFSVIGMASIQRSPLWWAAHHRHHHLNSDLETDVHSPIRHGFWWSHMGWIVSRENFKTRKKLIPDLIKFPELVFLDRFDIVIPIIFVLALFTFGHAIAVYFPQAGTHGLQMVIWGLISTTALFHTTFVINSLCHIIGNRRYQTSDTSRNNLFLALLTMGEGWHNNHHHYQASIRQGFFWWEIDMTYYILWFLSKLGIVWDLRSVPRRIRRTGLVIARK